MLKMLRFGCIQLIYRRKMGFFFVYLKKYDPGTRNYAINFNSLKCLKVLSF